MYIYDHRISPMDFPHVSSPGHHADLTAWL